MTKMASTTEIIRSRAQCATEPKTERLAGSDAGDELMRGVGLSLGAVLTAEGVSCWSISYLISKWIPGTIFAPGALHSKGAMGSVAQRLLA